MEEKTLVEKYPLLASSADPKRVGMTVRGALTAIAPVILLVSGLFGADLGQSMLAEIIESVVNITMSLSSALAAVLVAYGGSRKLYYRLKNAFTEKK